MMAVRIQSASCVPLTEATHALRDALLGLDVRATKRRQQALEALAQHSISRTERAQTLLTLGLCGRATCSFSHAALWLAESAELYQSIDASDDCALALLLNLEAQCTIGNLYEAKAELKAWVSDRSAPPMAALLGSAVVKLCHGEINEALELVRASPKPVDAEGTLAHWKRLLEAELLLELNRPDDALPILEHVQNTREQESCYDEAYLRARALLARLQVERLCQNLQANDSAAVRRTQMAVNDALRFVQNSPRYLAMTVHALAQLQGLQGNGEAEQTFLRALGLLEQVGAQLDLGRTLGRQTRFRRQQMSQPISTLMARSHNVLSQIGATAWLALLDDHRSPLHPLGTGVSLKRSTSQMKLGEENDVELKAVFEVNRAISSLLSLEPLLEKILVEVFTVFKAERGALLQLQEGAWRCVVARGMDASLVVEGGGQISFSVIKESVKSGKVLLSENAQLDSRFQNKASVQSGDIRSVMCAPLSGKSGLLGALYLDSRLSQRLFKPQHVELMEFFSTQAATAIENAQAFQRIEDLNLNLERKVKERTSELQKVNEVLESSLDALKNSQLRIFALQKEAMEKEMELARGLQQQIVPARGLHALNGARVCGHIETASQVGGDFWTYFSLPDEKTLLLIGDVTGHGVAAGMLTTVARAAFDSLTLHRKEFELSELMQTVSDVLLRASAGTMTMTTFAVLLQPREQTMTFVNAGHPDPFWLQHMGGLPQVNILKAPGLNSALGITERPTYSAHRVTYRAGDRIAFYTDGLAEGVNSEGKPLGARRLQKALLMHASVSVEEHLARVLKESLDHFGDSVRDDDMSLVLLELL